VGAGSEARRGKDETGFETFSPLPNPLQSTREYPINSTSDYDPTATRANDRNLSPKLETTQKSTKKKTPSNGYNSLSTRTVESEGTTRYLVRPAGEQERWNWSQEERMNEN
jgi:hypothetical protein